ncbi:MAG: VWA domain-containing protein [Clostridia bacterium]|nr:VWA domain-containing protein [Clostridia bacterium]
MKKSKQLLILFIVAILAFIVVLLVLMNMGIIPTLGKDSGSGANNSGKIAQGSKPSNSGKIDDWCYEPQNLLYDTYIMSGTSKGVNSMATMDAAMATAGASEATIGYSVGGAKDINNFRENIDKGYFPLETDITYEGIYYDYSFDTGNTNIADSDKMFYPTYSTAISKDPISEENEYFISVGLNSNIKESDFARKKLNLVLVLDISGSMSSSINGYYYDFDEDDDKETKTKMRLAEESINILLDQLNPEDSVGLVLFDNSGYLAKPLNLVGETDIDAIKEHILDVEAMGGTNFEAGYNLANETIEEYGIRNINEYENRIIVITDAMPNVGETSNEGLRKLMEQNAKRGVYTSFIGVGLDFNTEVVKNITDVKGANYYSVSSEKEFNDRMGEEFEYMVTPLVFDLNMDLESDGFEIEKVYGTDSVDAENGNIMHVNTLFPSKTNEDGEVRGGIIVLKLKKTKEDANELTLKVSYQTRDGQKDSSEEIVQFNGSEEYYDNTGIRKGIVLARYVNLIKNWTEYERDKNDRYLITIYTGIFDYPDDMIKEPSYDDYYYYSYYSENERTSVNLSVSEQYKEIFNTFKTYMEKEIKEIKDSSLNQEITILEKILNA